MLDDGNPPDDWGALYRAASANGSIQRLDAATPFGQ